MLQFLGIPDFMQRALLEIPEIHFEEARTEGYVEICFNAEDAIPGLVAEVLFSLRHRALHTKDLLVRTFPLPFASRNCTPQQKIHRIVPSHQNSSQFHS